MRLLHQWRVGPFQINAFDFGTAQQNLHILPPGRIPARCGQCLRDALLHLLEGQLLPLVAAVDPDDVQPVAGYSDRKSVV